MKFLFLAILLIARFVANAQTSYDQKIEGSKFTFRMVGVPAGKFQMGSTGTLADGDERPVKTVELSAFWIGEHEVTFEEWDAYFEDASLPQEKEMDGITRATPQYIDLTWGMGRDASHPTNSMSQQAATMYCKWLYSKTGFFFRLPTEAEWEYACKAGKPDFVPIAIGTTSGKAEQDAGFLKSMGYSQENSGYAFHHVKELKPNAWGLYDMLGNLSEWTIDQYDAASYQKMSPKDPMPSPGPKYPRTVRGGSFLDNVNQLRCSNRIASDAKWNQRDPQIPKSRWWLTDAKFVGFRVVRPMKQPSRAEAEKFYVAYLK